MQLPVAPDGMVVQLRPNMTAQPDFQPLSGCARCHGILGTDTIRSHFYMNSDGLLRFASLPIVTLMGTRPRSTWDLSVALRDSARIMNGKCHLIIFYETRLHEEYISGYFGNLLSYGSRNS